MSNVKVKAELGVHNNLAFTTTLLYILYMSPTLMRIEYDVMKSIDHRRRLEKWNL